MKLSILLLLGVLSSTYGYHILVSFIIPSHSHNQLGKGIVDALLKAGHTVSWITPFPDKVGKNPPKNLNIIDVSHVQELANVDMTDSKFANAGISFVKEFATNVTIGVYTSQNVKDVIVKTQFDAVITELFFSDTIAGLAAVLKVPWILMSAIQLMPGVESQVDEIRSPNTIPLAIHEASIPMTLKERVVNLGISAAMTVSNWISWSDTEALYQRLFAPLAAARNVELPPFADAFYNVSILFLNAHESLFPAFSVPPNVIGIAGFHIEENPPPLPKDLQDLLDKSKQGVIYFSLGSVVRSAALPPHTRKAILAKFAALPYTVLWKFEEEIKDLPPNVYVRKWMPQPSILVHPNVKVFITHGGQLSCLEAIWSGVPLLAIPVFGDQPFNAERAKQSGFAQRVTFGPDMADELDEKLREILNNPAYTERVKFLSMLFRDRPVPPSKLVSYYTELAIKSKGAYHLRSPSLQYSWVQRSMFDVLLLAVVVLAIIFTLLRLAVRTCFRIICGKSSTTPNLKKKTN
ncbi:unnamed protein product [Arctia plantaginis]|uniref:UDP-glucuronosyltransferase n=1 Tax=Arctia plantaginis TaxID=874455 RepID=A0A8S0ZF02_ARCPL|nr:unnamed protein product [Arctia plantaginis]